MKALLLTGRPGVGKTTLIRPQRATAPVLAATMVDLRTLEHSTDLATDAATLFEAVLDGVDEVNAAVHARPSRLVRRLLEAVKVASHARQRDATDVEAYVRPEMGAQHFGGSRGRHRGGRWIVRYRWNDELRRLPGRGPQERHPVRIRRCVVVSVFRCSADRGIRPPETETILRLKGCNGAVGEREVYERQNARRPPLVERAPLDDGSGDVVPHGLAFEPEECGLCLIGTSRRAVEPAERLQEAEVARVAPAAQPIRSTEAMTIQVNGERREAAPAWKQGHGPQRRRIEWRREIVIARLAARHIDRFRDWTGGRRPRARHDPIAGSPLEVRACSLLSEDHTLILGRTVVNAGQ